MVSDYLLFLSFLFLFIKIQPKKVNQYPHVNDLKKNWPQTYGGWEGPVFMLDE